MKTDLSKKLGVIHPLPFISRLDDLEVRIKELEFMVEEVAVRGMSKDKRMCERCSRVQDNYDDILGVLRVGRCHRCMEE